MRRQSDRDGADLHNGVKSQHRDSAVYISDALVHKGKQKGVPVRRTARLVAILGGVNSGCDVRFVKCMRRLTRSFKPNRLRPGRLPWMFVPSV
eukprot:scaffold30618_cov33-Attheya_sp.AAC.1